MLWVTGEEYGMTQESKIPDKDSDQQHGVTDAETAPVAANSTEVEIRLRAYELWEERGRPDGTPDDDWFRAEQELLSQAGTESGSSD
jgi:hypothetical protein